MATLVDDIVVERGCEVALRQDAERWVPVAPGERSFLALVAEAQGVGSSAPRTFALVDLPRAIYARRTSAERSVPASATRAPTRPRRRSRSAALSGAPGQSFVLLSRCVDSLGSRPLVDPQVLPAARACEGPLEVRTTASASCPAQIRVGSTPLEAGRPATLASCAGGVPASYSVDAGSGRDPLRVIVGMVLAREAATPLQRRLHALAEDSSATGPAALADSRALYSARVTGGIWSFVPAEDADSELLSEARASAAAGELVLARGDRSLGAVAFTADERGAWSGRFPDAVFARAMREKFGSIGASLAPTVAEARAALAPLRVCIPGRYEARPSPIGTLSNRDACAPLRRVVTENEATLERDIARRRLWAERTLWRVSARGVDPIERSRTEPVVLRAAHTNTALSWVLSTGDRVGVEGDPRGLYVCHEEGCAPLDSSGQRSLESSGLYELRAATDEALARTAQATTLARWVVIDPLRDWTPVGLVTRNDLLPGPLWMQLARDDDETYAFERRVHSLDSRVAFTERSVVVRARARSEGEVESVLVSDIALLANDPRRAGAAARSALTVVLSRDERCPDARASDVRAQAIVDPNALAPGAVFYAFLAEDQGASRPLACLSRARFRVRPRRTIASVGPLVVGALGDPRLAWFSPWEQWGAVGAIVPALYARASMGPWISTEMSIAVVGGFAPGRGALDVVGPALVLDVRAAVLTIGAALFIPRLSSDRAPTVSFAPFVALDIGSIYELAGGR